MKIALIIAAFVISDAIFLIGIIAVFMKMKWAPIANAHPQQTPADDAIFKKFQSYKIDILNLSFCIHTSVDEQYLHLIPVMFLQKLGAKPTSISWNSITDVKPNVFGNSLTARIGNHKITGPAWCLELAMQDEDELQVPQDASEG